MRNLMGGKCVLSFGMTIITRLSTDWIAKSAFELERKR